MWRSNSLFIYLSLIIMLLYILIYYQLKFKLSSIIIQNFLKTTNNNMYKCIYIYISQSEVMPKKMKSCLNVLRVTRILLLRTVWISIRISIFSGSNIEHITKLYECPTCNLKFASKGGLGNHMNIHMKTHQCDVCLKCFPSKYDLDRHVRTHSGEKPYVCPTGDKLFSTKCGLKLQLKI